LTIDGGSHGNTFFVNATPSGALTDLNSGAGADFVQVFASTGPLTVQGGGGQDSVVIGNSGLTQGITGNVDVQNSTGKTALTVDDSADSTGRTISLHSTHMSPAPVTTGAIVGFTPTGTQITWAAGQLSNQRYIHRRTRSADTDHDKHGRLLG
jgi:hypothetical protein